MNLNLKIPTLFVISTFIVLTITNYEDANSQIVLNDEFILSGSGFAASNESLKTSEVEINISTSTTDGFISLGAENFVFTNLEKTVLRDGNFLRINGIAQNDSGDKLSIETLGRLIQSNSEGSIFSFNGKLIQDNTSYKVIYSAKLTKEKPTLEDPIIVPEEANEIIIDIFKDSADPSSINYIDAGQPTKRGYYSSSRIIVEPGTTITWINNDDVSHSISSGTGLTKYSRASQGMIKICDGVSKLDEGFSYNATDCSFTTDGRISSGEILPGESWSTIIKEPGFYRLVDVDYVWMTSTVYSFSNVDSMIIGSPGEDFN